MKIWKVAAILASAILLAPGIPAAADTVSHSGQQDPPHIGNMGYIPDRHPVYDRSDLKDEKSGKTQRAAALPSSFDLRTTGVLSSVKDQKNTGSCWAFAALGSAESNLVQKGIAENPDLSERQLVFAAYNRWLDPLNLTEGDTISAQNGDSYNLGGNCEVSATALASWRGAVTEDKAPFAAIENGDVDDLSPAFRLPDSLMYQEDSYHLENAETIYLATPNRIKRALMEKGYAAVIDVHGPETNEEYSSYYSSDYQSWYVDDDKLSSNHSVLLVGWDDNYPVSNFNRKHRPSKPGAWLFRNSWGTDDVGEDGYCWVSYEDSVLNKEDSSVTFYDMDTADNYDCNYQYDNGAISSWLSGYSAMANVYQAQHSESLEAVSFWTTEREVNYEIQIYRHLKDTVAPVGDTPAGEAIRGTVDEIGYHTIDFTEHGASDIPLEPGERFSVVIRLDNGEDGPTFIAAENDMYSDENDGIFEEVSAKEGESYLMDTAGHWSDITSLGDSILGNLRIKAFTGIDNSVPCDGIAAGKTSLTVGAGQSVALDYTLSPENVTDTLIFWKSEDDSIARVSNGVVYGVSDGATTVTGEINGHRLSIAVTVREIPTESLSLPESVQLLLNQQQKLTAVPVPADSTDSITWRSYDASKVTVRPDGTILALSATGSRGVIIEASAGSQRAQCLVTVTEPKPEEVLLEDMQSFHPYLTDATQRFEYAREGAVGYNITFSDNTNLEEDYDFLVFYNEDGEEMARYTGDELAGQTIYIDSSIIKMRLIADEFSTAYGFLITAIEPEFPPAVEPTSPPVQTVSPAPTTDPVPTTAPAPTTNPAVSSPADNTPAVSPTADTSGTGQSASASVQNKRIVKKLRFSPAKKKVRAGKKLKLKKYLKITKKRAGKVTLSWRLTKKKYKKWASLSQKGVLKAKKKGRGKTLYVRVKAGDGSGKTARIKIVIR